MNLYNYLSKIISLFDLKLLYFLIFIIPGFISMKVWGIMNPTKQFKLIDYIYEIIIYSCINIVLLFWLIPIFKILNCFLYQFFIFIAFIFIGPIFWPIFLQKILTLKWFRGKIIHPTPKAWDYFFSKGLFCFMLIHLKNGKKIGGLYYRDSFASSYPEKEDLYVKEVWEITSEGKFIKKIDRTMGMLINYNSIDYIELFENDD